MMTSAQKRRPVFNEFRQTISHVLLT